MGGNRTSCSTESCYSLTHNTLPYYPVPLTDLFKHLHLTSSTTHQPPTSWASSARRKSQCPLTRAPLLRTTTRLTVTTTPGTQATPNARADYSPETVAPALSPRPTR